MDESVEPFASGMLDVGEDSIYWETAGNPDGQPVVWLHGGPGSGLGSGGHRRHWDPDHYLIVGIDQRGCGRSRPLATEPGLARDELLARLARNTTRHLIGDIEAVREHLGIEHWQVAGASFGATLALAYAQTHAERVSAVVVAAVTNTSRVEVDWVTETVGRIFPIEWAEFESASRRRPGERVVDAYARLLTDVDPAARADAAAAWCRWEDTHVSLAPNHQANPRFDDPEFALLFATLVTHYWSNDGFGGDQIIDRVDAIAHLPGVLIHGKLDVSGPLVTAWNLHRAWPGSELIVTDDGHGGTEMWAEFEAATGRLRS